MRRIVRCLLPFSVLALATVLAAGKSEPVPTIDVTAYGASPDSGWDATVAFQKAIAAVQALHRRAVLRIPKGRYDFFPNHATRRRCYYSNATEENSDAMRTIAIDLTGIDWLTVEGAGARLVMRGKMTMLAAERCRDLTLSGLEFDFARPTVSEITAVEKGSGFWVGRVHPDSWYRLKGDRVEWYGENWSAFHNLVQHYDPETKTTWRGDDPTAGATSIKQLEDRLLRFEVPAASLDSVVAGRTYQFRDVTRDETGMWFNRCQGVAMSDVKVRAMAGFGMLFQFTRDIDLHLTVAPAPHSGRTCASAADILHFSGCRGKVRVRECVLTAAHDDAINVHGTHLRVVSQAGDRTIRVRFMHPQTWGFAAFAPGDEIEFVRKDTLLSYAKAKVVRLEMTADPREQTLTLDRPVPAGLLLQSDVVENVTWTPSVEISGCQIGQVPTRGILVTTRRPVRIMGNTFWRIPMPSILVSDDAQSWYESGPVRSLTIGENRFDHCSGPVVEVDPSNTVFAGFVHSGILVEDNDFMGGGLPLVSARAVKGLTVSRNRVAVQGRVTVIQRANLVHTDHCSTVRVGNRYLPLLAD